MWFAFISQLLSFKMNGAGTEPEPEPPKQGFIPTEPLKALEKKGKCRKKNKEFLAGARNKEFPKQGKQEQEKNRNRTGSIRTDFQEPNQNRKRTISLNCTEMHTKTLSPEESSKPKTGTARTVPCAKHNPTEPNRGHFSLCKRLQVQAMAPHQPATQC